jgi:hypothetical protein
MYPTTKKYGVSLKSKANTFFEPKYDFFKTRKNLYTRLLCITNL